MSEMCKLEEYKKHTQNTATIEVYKVSYVLNLLGLFTLLTYVP